MSARRFEPPDPEGHHDDLTTDELDGLTLAVPDDARDLDDDRSRWLAEQADPSPPRQPPPRQPPPSPRRHTSPRGTSPRRRSRLTTTAAVLVLAMAVVAVSGAIGAFFVPDTRTRPPSAPLADAQEPPGRVDGLLPDVELEEGTTRIAARSLRPAVVALVPEDCSDCLDWLREVRGQTAEFGLDVSLVVGPDQAAQGGDLEAALDSIRIDVLTDPTNAFADAYQPTGRMLVLVRDDGVVTDILQDPPLDLRIESALLPLSQQLLDQV